MADGIENYKLQMVVLALLSFAGQAVSILECPDCGKIQVPYPLSTSKACGDQLYKVRCSAGNLLLDTINGSSYIITSISPKNRHLIIRTKGFNQNSCTGADIQSEGIWLNHSLAFTITNRNTIMLYNCSNSTVRASAKDCTSGSLCYAYMKYNIDVNTRCNGLSCCSYTTGGSKTAYRLDIAEDKCTAYESFVNLNAALPVKKWPEPMVQIQWEKPREPLCTFPQDCKGLSNATCLPDHVVAGEKRCFCNPGLEWDPINWLLFFFLILLGNSKASPYMAMQSILPSTKGPLLNLRYNYVPGLTFTACGIVIIIIFFLLVKRHQKHIQREAHRKLVKQREDILNSNNHGKTAKLYSAKEMKRSTTDFSKQNLLGIGGFGEVYKANLDDGKLAAIKKAKIGNTLGMDQVLNEICVLCQVNHRSLVQLLGTCLDLDQPVLVFEYIANGTLFDHLHGRYSNEWGTLTWQRRLLIAKQTAEGIAYLHFSAVPPIFHRDIKSSNILLDEKLDAKVSDFGLSRLVDTEGTHISTCAQGTLGYLDPEYYLNYQLTDKSDVYSFGVVLLELLTSKKAIDFNRDNDDVNLAVYASKLADADRLLDAVDTGLRVQATKLEFETMKAFGLLAVACVDEQRNNRPSMREVTEELEYIISIISKHTSTAFVG
ncbi:Wall-associated receptor kinase-like 20 [Bienertia sinuspersici]